MRERRRVHSNGFSGLTAEQQVWYIIANWEDEIWTPVNAEVEFGNSIDDLEYRDYYFIPRIIEEIEGTVFEKYKTEIIQGYLNILFF